MSTGADCRIREEKDGWYYDLQRYPYGETQDYDTFGPFSTFGDADDHLRDNHANPGGYTVSALPGCEHATAYRKQMFGGRSICRKCGRIFNRDEMTSAEYAAKHLDAREADDWIAYLNELSFAGGRRSEGYWERLVISWEEGTR